MTSHPHFTHCGLPGIDLIPFGMHACHFFADADQLVATLAPYFAAGLSSAERCLWVTAPPLSASQAVHALRAACDGVDEAIQRGALRIVDVDQWGASPASPSRPDLAQLWLQEEERALADGYNGLRIAGSMGFLGQDGAPASMGCEQALTARFNGRRIVALCSYALAQCDAQQIRDVMQAHHCAFERPGDGWQVVPFREVHAGAGRS